MIDIAYSILIFDELFDNHNDIRWVYHASELTLTLYSYL